MNTVMFFSGKRHHFLAGEIRIKISWILYLLISVISFLIEIDYKILTQNYLIRLSFVLYTKIIDLKNDCVHEEHVRGNCFIRKKNHQYLRVTRMCRILIAWEFSILVFFCRRAESEFILHFEKIYSVFKFPI